MPESESGLNPDSPETNKERSSLEKKIDRLNELEEIFKIMDIELAYKRRETVDEKGNLVVKNEMPLAEKMKGIIKRGHAGNKGLEKEKNIKVALAEGRITEQDLDARINNIYRDLVTLEEKMQRAKSDDEVSELTRDIVDVYMPPKSADWPD